MASAACAPSLGKDGMGLQSEAFGTVHVSMHFRRALSLPELSSTDGKRCELRLLMTSALAFWDCPQAQTANKIRCKS